MKKKYNLTCTLYFSEKFNQKRTTKSKVLKTNICLLHLQVFYRIGVVVVKNLYLEVCAVFVLCLSSCKFVFYYACVRSNLISGLSSNLLSLHCTTDCGLRGRDVETKLIVKIRNILDSLIFYLDNSNCQTPLTAPSSPVTWKVRLSVADKKEFSEKANNGLRSCVLRKNLWSEQKSHSLSGIFIWSAKEDERNGSGNLFVLVFFVLIFRQWWGLYCRSWDPSLDFPGVTLPRLFRGGWLG